MAARKPQSAIDDIVKWLAKSAKNAEGFSPAEVKQIKRYARGIGHYTVYEKEIAPNVAKKAAKGKIPKRVAEHLEFMADRRQDKAARVYGDYPSPHKRFRVGEKGGNKQKELNKKFHAAWQEEESLGRSNARKAAAKAKAPAKKAPAKAKAPAKKAPATRRASGKKK